MRTLCLVLLVSVAPQILADGGTVLRQLAQKYKATQYQFEADLSAVRTRPERPDEVLAKASVRVTSAGRTRYAIEVEPAGQDRYLVASDGRKRWTYFPKRKQYIETDSVPASDDAVEPGDRSEWYARMVMPLLSAIDVPGDAVEELGTAEVMYENRKYKWPVVRVTRRRQDRVRLIELTVDPETLRVGRMFVSDAGPLDARMIITDLTVTFRSLEIDAATPDSTFQFTPPPGATRVGAVPVPGLRGSYLLNRTAPNFTLKTLNGERISLAALRGRPVLLHFWAAWTGMSRTELPLLSKVYDEYKDKGLVVLGVNNPNTDPSRHADLGLVKFPTADDPNNTAHRLYRVRVMPVTFLIDSEGTVVRYVLGARSEAAWREALKAVGL